ncbi:CorA family divalent cation transporter [Phenylobacterium sp.]|uniref:CorA family divalent cation transporter n=1 Tax=Phenylobacterium sp. TaxID=1871053 RepID=UPI0035B0F981
MPISEEWAGPAHGVICAYRFLDGAPQPLGPDFVPAAEPAGAWTWTHLRLSDVRARGKLTETPGLPAEALELFAEGEPRVQISQVDGWVIGALPDLQRDLAGRPGEEGRLVFAFDACRLITGRVYSLHAVDDLRRAVDKGQRLESPVHALVELVELYVGLIEGLLDDLGDELSGIEDYVLAKPQHPHETRLAAARREIARHRRELQALRSVLARAQAGRHGRRIDMLADAFVEGLAWMEDVDAEAAGLAERGRLLHEEMDTLINSATNRNMGALTVISTLLIPPTLITGAFGMNVPGLPFEHSRFGFVWASAVCVAVVGAALLLLRRMRVLG